MCVVATEDEVHSFSTQKIGPMLTNELCRRQLESCLGLPQDHLKQYVDASIQQSQEDDEDQSLEYHVKFGTTSKGSHSEQGTTSSGKSHSEEQSDNLKRKSSEVEWASPKPMQETKKQVLMNPSPVPFQQQPQQAPSPTNLKEVMNFVGETNSMEPAMDEFMDNENVHQQNLLAAATQQLEAVNSGAANSNTNSSSNGATVSSVLSASLQQQIQLLSVLQRMLCTSLSQQQQPVQQQSQMPMQQQAQQPQYQPQLIQHQMQQVQQQQSQMMAPPMSNVSQYPGAKMSGKVLPNNDYYDSGSSGMYINPNTTLTQLSHSSKNPGQFTMNLQQQNQQTMLQLDGGYDQDVNQGFDSQDNDFSDMQTQLLESILKERRSSVDKSLLDYGYLNPMQQNQNNTWI